MLITPVFFASIGLNVNIHGMTQTLIIFTIILCVIAVISKIAGCGLGALLCKYGKRESVQIGAGMVCRGEVALIVAQKGINPTVASLIMSLESVISVLAGWAILHQTLTKRELAGCVFMFAAIIIVQLKPRENGGYHEEYN